MIITRKATAGDFQRQTLKTAEWRKTLADRAKHDQ